MYLTVIIPTRNRVKLISDLLDSLANQTNVTFDWEVLVVDNNSTDNTYSIVKWKREKLPIKIRYYKESNIGLHYGRNRGAIEAKGEVLAYLDDDMILDNNWILGVNLILAGKADLVLGKILPKWESNPPIWLQKQIINKRSNYLGIIDLGKKAKSVSTIFGGNIFVKRKIVMELGGFNPDGFPPEFIKYRGDGEGGFYKKFIKKNYKSYYDPVATVFHIIPNGRITLEYQCKRAFNEGISHSFSKIRSEKYPDISLFNKLFKLKYYKNKYKYLLDKLKVLTNSKNITIEEEEINRKINEAFLNGFNYHQKQVNVDKDLYNWVVRDNYFEK